MKKLFGQKRLKDKAKQRDERNAENDFLYGRRGQDGAEMTGGARTGRSTMFAGFDGGQTSTASRSSAPKYASVGPRVGPGALGTASVASTAQTSTYHDLGESVESHSTSYYRGDSDEAVSARGQHLVEDTHEGGGNYPDRRGTPAVAKSGSGDSTKPASKSGGSISNSSRKPTPRLSQEEVDNQTKKRLKEERRRQRAGSKGDPDDDEKDNHNDYAQDEEDGYGKKSSRHHGQKKESRSRRHRKTERRPKTDGDDNHHRSRHSHSQRATPDDAAKSLRAGASAQNNDYENEDDHEFEQRLRRRREQDDRDRKLKQSLREQRNAAKDLRASGATSAQGYRPHQQPVAAAAAKNDHMEDEVEQRRRRQREQSEADNRLKASMREQRDAAKELRAKKSGVDDELEQRRRKRRDQDEKDRKLKESIKEQRNAAKSLRASGTVPGVTSIRTSAGSACSSLPVVNEESDRFNGNHRKSSLDTHGEEDHLEDHYGSNNELISNDRPQRRTFSEGLEDMGAVIQPATGKEIGIPDYLQEESVIRKSLIDMHIAQFRATAKTDSMDDEEYDEFFNDVMPDPNAPLDQFQEEEHQRNQARRQSRRVSATTMKINAWQQKYSLKKALELAERSPEMEWLSSFYRCDPRWQIMKFFDEVAREGGEAPMDENLAASPLAGLFNKASVFTVWRPTSNEAIKNMMLGIATGKGLDIKGKSAKRGNISSYVPFIQIYEEPHKEHVRAYIKDGKTVRVFYQSEAARIEAHEMILDIKDFMLFAAQDAMHVLSDEFADPAEQELAMKHLMYDDISLNVQFVDTYVNSANPVYGLDITERLFWESYVMMQDCSRPAGTHWDIGRGSELTFMEMNLKSIRSTPPPGEPRAVVYQMSKSSPMEPRMLLMAYEEYGRVKPVVSDFDCFLLGSRGVKYKNPIPEDQVELVKWSVENISTVLDERVASDSNAGWMGTWFKVLKKAALKGYYPKTPRYGNADPKSYEIIQVAVSRLQETGCVRHGAECFNWFFPQEIDDELLVISDTLPGNVKWKKVNVRELQEILIGKIEEGFTFPINPKWVLCDPGWRRVYDKLLASQKPNVQDSLNCWLPPGTGLRDEIDKISKRHPHGFGGTSEKMEGTEMRDQMEDDLERYMKVQRAWRKLRLLLFWIRFAREKRREKEELMALRARLADA